MAQLKDLIVNGPSRFIGDVYATTFTGNLAGNANTATNATNAGMIAGLSVHSGRNNEANKIVRTDQNGYLQVGYINSSSGHEKNASNPTYVWGSNSSDSYLRSYQTSSLSVNYATSSGSCSGNAATATKAGYLDTGTMTLYTNGGNEINFGGTNTSSTIYFGYRATGSKPVPTSFIFGGSGTATLTAGGFKKKDSSASYVLTGDGGHAAISGLSVNYANSSGSCSGNAATATNASSAGNADKLDGVHYQNILERQASGSFEDGAAKGWFRIAETLTTDNDSPTFLLAIQRNYLDTENESYLFSISISFGGGISITQLSGYANTRLITKIRVDWDYVQKAYVDLYIKSSSINKYYWYTVGCAKSYTAWIANPTLVGRYPQEFTTVQGCKSDLGFTGYLTGTASSASKWVYPRTITLTGSITGSVSIDGSGDVSLATTTNHTHPLSLTSKPTTISGYGITDAYTASTIDSKLSGYLSLSGGTMTGTIIVDSYTAFGPTGGNFYLGTPKYPLLLRSSGTTTINGNTLLHSGNFNSYAPKLDGTGATGTWGINITGNAATATNADTLDGYHKTNILRSTVAPTSVISLNDVVTEGIDFTSWDYAHSVNVNNQPNGNGASSAACVVSFGTDYPFQIYSDYNDTSYLYYRSYYGGNGWKAWRRFAFIDSNVASASKLKNSRTIWGQSFNGTGNVSGGIEGAAYIEMFNSKPYIDFHYGNSTADYTSRIIEGLSGQLTVTGKLRVGLNDATSTDYAFHVVGDGYFTENVITESDFSSRGDAIIDGNIGIGTHHPDYNLDVYGNMRITGPI